jgi:hypothetical protein
MTVQEYFIFLYGENEWLQNIKISNQNLKFITCMDDPSYRRVVHFHKENYIVNTR